MPGPKMGPRPEDFDETVLCKSPSFVKWRLLSKGESLRYACREFIKGRGNDEERLMRRIMIARRNNLRDHALLKQARKHFLKDLKDNNKKKKIQAVSQTAVVAEDAAATGVASTALTADAAALPNSSKEKKKKDVSQTSLVEDATAESTVTATEEAAAEDSAAAGVATATADSAATLPKCNCDEDEAFVVPEIPEDLSTEHNNGNICIPSSTSAPVSPANQDNVQETALENNQPTPPSTPPSLDGEGVMDLKSENALSDQLSKPPRRTRKEIMRDVEMKLEMDSAAVEATRSYKVWLALDPGAELVYNQKYVKGQPGHDWLLRKNIWRRMRYRRECKFLVEQLRETVGGKPHPLASKSKSSGKAKGGKKTRVGRSRKSGVKSNALVPKEPPNQDTKTRSDSSASALVSTGKRKRQPKRQKRAHGSEGGSKKATDSSGLLGPMVDSVALHAAAQLATALGPDEEAVAVAVAAAAADLYKNENHFDDIVE